MEGPTLKQRKPDVVIVMHPVDGGRAMIGMIECPHCGQTHYTTDIRCGERRLFCGTGHADAPTVNPDGTAMVTVTRII